MNDRKIGAGHAEAMFRLGIKELRNAANPSRESIADTEVGLYATLTQGEIAQSRGSYGLDAHQENSTDARLNQFRDQMLGRGQEQQQQRGR